LFSLWLLASRTVCKMCVHTTTYTIITHKNGMDKMDCYAWQLHWNILFYSVYMRDSYFKNSIDIIWWISDVYIPARCRFVKLA
jgi:hypothetical protein